MIMPYIEVSVLLDKLINSEKEAYLVEDFPGNFRKCHPEGSRSLPLTPAVGYTQKKVKVLQDREQK